MEASVPSMQRKSDSLNSTMGPIFNCLYGVRNFNTLDLRYDPLPRWGSLTWLKVKKEHPYKITQKLRGPEI